MKTYRSANGTPLKYDSVLTREECRRRSANAHNAAESYRGWLNDCREMLAEAQTDDQKRIATGFCELAETRLRFEQQMAVRYERLSKGEAL